MTKNNQPGRKFHLSSLYAASFMRASLSVLDIWHNYYCKMFYIHVNSDYDPEVLTNYDEMER